MKMRMVMGAGRRCDAVLAGDGSSACESHAKCAGDGEGDVDADDADDADARANKHSDDDEDDGKDENSVEVCCYCSMVLFLWAIRAKHVSSPADACSLAVTLNPCS